MKLANELTERHRGLILAFAEHDMNVRETAMASYMSWTNVNFHLNRIYKLTGLNPKNFYDLVELVKMAKTEVEDGR
jgi:sugar diacid utilization regulator